MTIPRATWSQARAESPARAAWREGKVHSDAVSEWLWIVAPMQPMSTDGWWPVIAFRIYAGFGTTCALHSSALDTVEDWQPVIPGTKKGDQCLALLARTFKLRPPEVHADVAEIGPDWTVDYGSFVRPLDADNEAKYFVLSQRELRAQ